MANNSNTSETPASSNAPPSVSVAMESSPPRRSKEAGVPKDIIMTPPTPRTTASVTASATTSVSGSPTSIRAVRSSQRSPASFGDENSAPDVLGPLPTMGGAAGLGSTDHLECSMRPKRENLGGTSVEENARRRHELHSMRDDAAESSIGNDSLGTPFPEECSPPQRRETGNSQETGGSSTLSAVTLPNELHELVDLDDIHGSGKGWIVGKGNDYREHRLSVCDGNSSLSSGTMRGPGSEIDADELERLRRVRVSTTSIQYTREQFFKDEIMKGNFPTNADAPQEARSCSEDKWHFKSSKNLDDDFEHDAVRMTGEDAVTAGKLQGYGNPMASQVSSADSIARHVRTARVILILMVMACGAVIGYQIYRDENQSRNNSHNDDYYNPGSTPEDQGKAKKLINLTYLCDEDPSSSLCERVCEDAQCCLEPTGSASSCYGGANITVCNEYVESCALFFEPAESAVQKGDMKPEGPGFPHPDLENVCSKVPRDREEACASDAVQACIRLCTPSLCCYDGTTKDAFQRAGTCSSEICGDQYGPCTRLYLMDLWGCKAPPPTAAPSEIVTFTHGGVSPGDVDEKDTHDLGDTIEGENNGTEDNGAPNPIGESGASKPIGESSASKPIGGNGAPQSLGESSSDGDSPNAQGNSGMEDLGRPESNTNNAPQPLNGDNVGDGLPPEVPQADQANDLGRSMNPGLRNGN